jgi:LIM domain kinase 1
MSSTYSDFSTQGHGAEGTDTIPPSMSSIMTIRPSPSPNVTVDPMTAAGHAAEPTATASGMSVASYTTAASSLSSTAATEGGSMHVSPSALVHRFTLIQKRRGASSAEAGAGGGSSVEGWSPFDFFFSGGSGRCDICQKRLGWKPALECDDCGLRCARFPSCVLRGVGADRDDAGRISSAASSRPTTVGCACRKYTHFRRPSSLRRGSPR